ncbi:MAG: NAD-dependent malic enzyme [Clostridiales bacterium]|nr:NAD-dependent malic enzyme [Clostridiales bacterium]
MNKNELRQQTLKMHEQARGKIAVISTVPVETKEQLSLAYTPGVAEPCLDIQKDPELAYKYTRKWNLVAVASDGSAVLGLGDIGGIAGMPVMEGKAVLFKEFGDVDAFPIILDTNDVDEIVETLCHIAPTFGGINLEDISAPRCFEIEERLIKRLDIPVFHDDQHGTAVVTLAALMNALKLVNKNMEDIKIVINGAGAAGVACTKLLISSGVKNIIMCDRKGILYKDRDGMNDIKKQMVTITNPENVMGSLAVAMIDSDVFIGVSAPGVVSKEMVASMNDGAIVFPMSNPVPEIFPDEAKKAGAKVVGTGRSDFANQINNVLAFPGIFRGALDVRAKVINEEMKIAAANAIAEIAQSDGLTPEYIIPAAFDKRVKEAVSEAVKKAARDTGVARI